MSETKPTYGGVSSCPVTTLTLEEYQAELRQIFQRIEELVCKADELACTGDTLRLRADALAAENDRLRANIGQMRKLLCEWRNLEFCMRATSSLTNLCVRTDTILKGGDE